MRLQIEKAIPTLAVTDIQKAREFYGKKLGFTELEVQEESGEEGIAYEIAQGAYLYVYERSSPSGSTATACELAVRDVEGTVKALREQGIAFEEYNIPDMGIQTRDGIASMDGLKTAWFKDPFGNILAVGNSFFAFSQKRAPARGATETQPLHA